MILNHELPIDLLLLEKKPVFHVADTHTNFKNAVPIRSIRAEDIWFAFVEVWASFYVEYPTIIRLDQESVLRSDYIRYVTEAIGIELHLSGGESHNPIGTGDRYHAPLRRCFKVILMNYPSLGPGDAFRYELTALKFTMGPRDSFHLYLYSARFRYSPVRIRT